MKCYGPTVAGVTTEEYVTEQFLTKYGHLSVMRMVQEVGEDFRPQIRQAEEALADLQKDRYDRGLFKGDDGAIRYAEQYAKLEERLVTLKERQRTAKPGGVKAEPTGETHAEQWKRSDVAGKRDLLLNAGGYVEVAPARRGGKKLDTSRLSVYFGEEGHMRRAAAAKESERETEVADSQV